MWVQIIHACSPSLLVYCSIVGFIGTTSYYDPPTLEYDGEVSVVNTTCGFENCSFDFTDKPCDGKFAVITCGISMLTSTLVNTNTSIVIRYNNW